jgi:hypothetical protein
MLPVAAALAACSAPPTRITAAPGMTADDFNRANAEAGARLRTDETDWIGVNAPVDLTIDWNGKTVTFEDRQRGGGVQISSHPDDYDRAGKPVGPPRIVSISFSIGRGMQKMTEVWPLMERHCRALSQMAGIAPAPLPAPEDIAARFRQKLAKSRSEFGDVSDQVICRGETRDFVFSLSATHYSDHRAHGGDYAFAFINGYIGKPLLVEDQPAL